jgi:hypothetical protein
VVAAAVAARDREHARMKPISPDSIERAAKVLRRLAAQERRNRDGERAAVLTKAAQICEAAAFVGIIKEVVLDPKLVGMTR